MAKTLVDLPSGIMTMLFECKYLKWGKNVKLLFSVKPHPSLSDLGMQQTTNWTTSMVIFSQKKTLSSILTVQLDLGASEQDYQAARKREQR